MATQNIKKFNMTLRDLELGDRFYPKSKAFKATPIFQVHGKPEFNSGYGSATRKCINLKTNEIVNKSCRLEIILSKPRTLKI